MSDNLEKNGLEVNESRLKKVAKMRRAVEIIKNYNQSNYIEMAEAELGQVIHHPWEFEETGETTNNPLGKNGEKLYRMVDNATAAERKHNRKVFDRAREIEELEWKELFTILEGQDYRKYNSLFRKARKAGMRDDRDLWNEWFDGSGMKGWWD
jgi:hypothetical protein